MKAQPYVVGLAILLATLVALVAAPPPPGTQPAAPPASKPAERPVDVQLDLAHKSPQGFMFVEEATSTTKAEGPSYDLVVTSAVGLDGTPENVFVRAGSMRIFRADAGRDDFTRHGGWYWRCGDTQGKAQFTQPGALIMVVRQQDGTVHWYALGPDFRC